MAKKAVIKSKQSKPAKAFTDESIKKLITDFKATVDPLEILDKFKKSAEEFYAAGVQNDDKAHVAFSEALENAYPLMELESHYLIAESIDSSKYRTLVIDLANKLVDEYNCKTPSEILLSEAAALAYCRMLEFGKVLSRIHRIDSINNVKVSYYGLLSKEVDRANRQFVTAIQCLRNLRQPSINVSFNANNAFVAQNQQINSRGTTNAEH